MPIGVGSVGDIISICLLAKDLVEALNSSRGAAAEYQEIVRELWGLERALLQVDLLSRTHNSSLELNALHETARRAAENCRVCIAEFLKKIKKYDPSLGETGSGSIFRDASRKIQWQVMQSSDVSKFRAEIGAHSQSISMLLATLSVSPMAVNDKKINARLTNSEDKANDEIQKQTALVAEVRDRLKENNTLISAVATKVSDALRFEWFRQMGSELKAMMNKIFRTNIATYEAVVSIQRVLPSHLERSMFREPFILEDAIGRVSPVHMDFINSWEAFDAILQLRFQDFQGFRKVQNKEYVLQEHATKREIKRTRPWDCAFLPGQRVDMSLVFMKKASAEQPDEIPSTNCPNCRAVSTVPQDSEAECAECGMWFRRITEITDVDPPPTPRVHAKRPPVEKVQFGQNAFQGLAFGPTPPSKFPPVSVKRKLDVVELAEDDIAHFKRIRLITTKERVRFIPGPFRQVQISGKDLPLAAAEKYEEEVSKAWEAFRTHEKSTGLSHPDTLNSLRGLAQILRNVGKSSAAEEILQTTLKELESLLVEKNPESLRFLMTSLMMALVDQKKLDAAEELWMRAVALFSKSVSAEENDALVRAFELAHPFRQNSLSTTKATGTAQESWLSNDRLLELFTTRRSPARRTNDPIPSTDPVPSPEGAPQSMVMAQLDAAEKPEVQVMETRKTKLGVDHPDTLTSMANLATMYWNQGRWGEAEELDLQVMETRKVKLGVDHSDNTLTSMTNLASTYKRQGRWGEAEELFVRVMKTSKTKLGSDHPDTLCSMVNLASTYRYQGRWDAAEYLELQVMETSKMKLGVDHSDTLRSMANLASTYRNQGRWEAAKELELQVLEMSKTKIGADHPDTLTSMANLAWTYRSQGRWKEAEELQATELEICSRVLGQEHPHTLTSMAHLALIWKGSGRDIDALKLMKQCVEVNTRILGANNPYTLASSTILFGWETE